MSRREVWESLRQNPDVSVLIVGAGINGIGTFRDLALQGVDVLLVDKGDFSSGASAASSHMLHGGIRYLENGEFRLVREALTERNRLIQNAAHYARPLPTTIPIFSWVSGFLNAPLKFLNLRDKPSERGAAVIKIGLIFYDWFTRGQQTLPVHQFFTKAESLKLRPAMNPDIVCTATYYDGALPQPERLSVELILDGEADYSGARALNYVALQGASGDGVILRDEVTGETITVKPKVLVNAAGPWIDVANQAMGRKTHFIGGTKGSHLVVDHPDLYKAAADSEIFFENKDGRICLIFPLLDKVILGTTDIRVDDPEKVECTEDEVDYMLNLVRHVFPDIHIDRSHIVFRFCGVRPLPSSDASRTGAISRDHSIRVIEPGSGLSFPVLSLVGGKWTTYRAFAEQTADAVLSRLNRTRKADTKSVGIGGGKGFPKESAAQKAWVTETASKTGVAAARVETLFRRYGTGAAVVAAFCAKEADAPLRSNPDYSRREVAYLVHQEKIVHLEDLVLRRSLLGMLGFVTGDLLQETAAILGAELGWSAERVQSEVTDCANLLHKRHGVPAERLAIRS